jgi:hypothetical protein
MVDLCEADALHIYRFWSLVQCAIGVRSNACISVGACWQALSCIHSILTLLVNLDELFSY